MEQYSWYVQPTARMDHALWHTTFNLRGSIFATKSALMVDLHSSCCSTFMERASSGNAWLCEQCRKEFPSLYHEEGLSYGEAPTTWFDYSSSGHEGFKIWIARLVESQVNPLTAILLQSHWEERFTAVLQTYENARVARLSDLDRREVLIRQSRIASGILLEL